MQDHSTRTPSFPPNLDDYAPWVATYGLVAPYGECQCGCGLRAPISTYTKKDKGRVKGQPARYCHSHWNHALSLEELFWQYVTLGAPDDCWEWQKNRHAFGHGFLHYRRTEYQAHRVSYELHNGAIPEGLHVLHKCDNPPCCNPNHLFLGTRLDNIEDRTKKGRSARGENVNTARLHTADVLKIRELHRAGITCAELARMYHIGESTARSIVKYRSWKHVPLLPYGTSLEAMP